MRACAENENNKGADNLINQNHHYHEDLKNNDPEFYELFNNFLNNDVSNNNNINLDERTKFMAITATLLGCQGYDEFREILPVALKSGLSPVEVKEIIYQAAAYLGIGRVYGFLKITNEIFAQQNINLPVEPQSTTNINTRREAGTNAQVEIFGEGMRNFWNSGPDETKHINLWLAKGLEFKRPRIDNILLYFCSRRLRTPVNSTR